MQPKIGDLAKKALGFVASIGGGILGFLASFIIAGIIMAFGEGGAAAATRFFRASSVRRGPRSSSSCAQPLFARSRKV
jgi:hypothetical protein